ncbi:hypothetical protein AB7C87_05955 [Natrarchaeobius sp. A-rgal3]|uniref:hypothetical protein n=1 Tax=Natrarchaeobius versutus TaxID=1679078 RepID=UPI003510B804
MTFDYDAAHPRAQQFDLARFDDDRPSKVVRSHRLERICPEPLLFEQRRGSIYSSL